MAGTRRTGVRLQAIAIGVVAVLLGTAAAPARADAATYAGTVAATPGLTDLWRLGEAPGASTAADAAGASPGAYTAASLGALGAISGDAGTAARFAGTGWVAAGNGPGFTDAAPPARTWTVDTVPADTRAVAILPSAVQPSATVTFSSADPGARFECRIDASGWTTACASPLAVPGGHVLAVRSVEAAGNPDATPRPSRSPPPRSPLGPRSGR